MEVDLIFEKVSKILSISLDESKTILSSILVSQDPESSLIEILGIENIEIIFEIIYSKDLILSSEISNDHYFYFETIIPQKKSIEIDQNELIPTSILKNNKIYFDYDKFNYIQSKLFQKLFNSDNNLLLSAPTGAGKTDVALVAILRSLLKKNRHKIIYIVPMKALATEITEKYKKKLKRYKVIEYTGDTNVTNSIVYDSDLIVCTPEKFDVATRKLNNPFSSIDLVVIDEIHLLGEDRGPVLECIVNRIFRMSEIHQKHVRIIGLSATLPNYKDVSLFIKAEDSYFFDSRYRPVPLKITVTGFKKQAKITHWNKYLIEKIKIFKENNKQVLIFVHSRLKTFKLAKMIMMELADLKHQLNSEFDSGDEKKRMRRKRFGFSDEIDLLVENKIGIHHAGLNRKERLKMESLFKDNQIDILVSTSTLAWGVNLPAYGVLIFGTSFYNPQTGGFDNIGILDVIQIFGRAGRPQFDTNGEAFLLLDSSLMEKYINQLNGSKDIESKMLFHVTDALNSEIYLKNVTTISTALLWIKNTFLYIRMQQNPALYGLCDEDLDRDEQALSQYIYLAFKRLKDCGLINIHNYNEDYTMWVIEGTELCRIASHYYISHETIQLWIINLSTLKNEFSFIELMIKSKEFENVNLRVEENTELAEIHNQLLLDCAIDFDYDGTKDQKLLLLVIAHLRNIKIKGFSLICDMNFVLDNFERLLEGLKEVFLAFKHYESFSTAFYLLKQISKSKIINQNRKAIVMIERLDKFIKIFVQTEGKNVLFIKKASKLLYAITFHELFEEYIEFEEESLLIEIHGDEPWTVLKLAPKIINDYSVFSLLKNGIHCCESKFTLAGFKENCIHFFEYKKLNQEKLISKKINDLKIKEDSLTKETKNNDNVQNIKVHTNIEELIGFDKEAKIRYVKLSSKSTEETLANNLILKYNLKVQSIIVEDFYLREKNFYINNLILEIFSFKEVLIICTDEKDVNDTIRTINTHLALKNRFDEYIHSLDEKNNEKLACTFNKAKSLKKKYSNVIIKGGKNKDGRYAIYDLLNIISDSYCIIFDNASFIKYLNHILAID